MSLAIAAEYSGVLLATPFDGALSREADELRREFDQAFTTPGRISANRYHEIASRLLTALKDATENEIYSTPESLCRALAVIQSLPNHVPLPDVVVEDDGEIGLDWEFGRRHVLSVS